MRCWNYLGTVLIVGLHAGEITQEMLDWVSNLKRVTLDGTTGLVLSPTLFVQVLEGKDISSLGFKGAIIGLPSPAALEQAPSDVKERLSAVESVDLREETVGFELAGE